MNLYNRVIKDLKIKRNRVLKGLLNCIPWDLERFSDHMPGVERGRYYLVTGQQKSGKSKISDELFVFKPILYAFENPDKISLKIKYFTLELSPEECFLNFLAYLLFYLSGKDIRKSPMQLRSINSKYPIEKGILDLLENEEYKKYIDFFQERVEFIDSITTPDGIYNNCRSYCEKHGKIKQKEIVEIDEITGLEKKILIDDYYEPDNKEEYFIIVIDNASLISTNGYKDLRNAMFDLSARCLVRLRNVFKATPVLIQQQMMATQDLDHIKMKLVNPTVAGLAENKATARDANYVLGIFSPISGMLKNYHGYNIDKWGDSIRFLEIINNRHGQAGVICPLLFLGDVGYFEELPLPDKVTEETYQKIEKPAVKPKTDPALLFFSKILKNELLQSINTFATRKRENVQHKKPKSSNHWIC